MQEYERKREQKRRERQLYHLRHARDYEALDLPMGAAKDEVKKAYRWVCAPLLGEGAKCGRVRDECGNAMDMGECGVLA